MILYYHFYVGIFQYIINITANPMTSPKKNIDQEQENTMFGQLIQI